MDIQETLFVAAPLGDVAEHIVGHLTAPPAEGTKARRDLDAAGIDFADIAAGIVVTKVTSRHYRVTSAAAGGDAAAFDYRIKAVPGGTEIAVKSTIDLEAVVNASREFVRKQIESIATPEQMAAYDAFYDNNMPQLKLAAEQALRQATVPALREWAAAFPAYIAKQKSLGGQGGVAA